MKIQLVSDLHMEFAPIKITNTTGANILILSGDICVADTFTRSPASPYYKVAQEWTAWFEAVCSEYERVYYVLGNHEHYHGRFYETAMLLQNTLGHIRNLVILDNEFDTYAGLTFVGTTLWTDFDRMAHKAAIVRDGLNDYRLIEGHNYRKLSPVATQAYHDEARTLIDYVANQYTHTIVVGHHAPSYRSITPEYMTGPYAGLNAGYASNMDEFIRAHPSIKLWTHGHVHSSHDYMIGSTRILANPRGYDRGEGAENERFDPALTVEI